MLLILAMISLEHISTVLKALVKQHDVLFIDYMECCKASLIGHEFNLTLCNILILILVH